VLGVLAGFGFYWFVVHSLTTRDPFLDMALFRDRNFAACLVLGFFTHATLYATVALLPPLLQQVLNYPALEAGFLFIPRALGSLLGMFVVARLATRVDPRWMMLAGLLFAAYGLWVMSRFTVDMGRPLIVWSGLIQGIGLGLVFIPVSAMAFSTLPQGSRTEAAGIYAVVRSLGASLGISVFITLLTRNAQINRAHLVEQVSPFNDLYRSPNLPKFWRLDDLSGLSHLSGVIDRQVAMIAYMDDFLVLMALTLALIPMILLISNPLRPGARGGSKARPTPVARRDQSSR
jgi:DHA2 family multidrug resistance protein